MGVEKQESKLQENTHVVRIRKYIPLMNYLYLFNGLSVNMLVRWSVCLSLPVLILCLSDCWCILMSVRLSVFLCLSVSFGASVCPSGYPSFFSICLLSLCQCLLLYRCVRLSVSLVYYVSKSVMSC